jgi:hypothetical protein
VTVTPVDLAGFSRRPAFHRPGLRLRAAAASVLSEVEVAVSPDVAFKAFTEEMDLWWVRGPINFNDAGRVAEVRCGPHAGPWIEFQVGNSSLMIFRREAGPPEAESMADRSAGPAHVPWVYVDDLDAHLAHAEQAGAAILHRKEWPWLPTYVAEDPEGNRWTFAQARPTQRP